MNPKAVKNIRKVERPRPLRLHSDSSLKSPLSPPVDVALSKKSYTDILNDIDALHISISNCIYDDTTVADISKMCSILKSRGHEIDLSMKDRLDHYYVTLRNASREERLDLVSRLKLLEVIELRAMKWRTNENLTNYYKSKILELEQTSEKAPLTNSVITNYGAHVTQQQQQQQQLASPSTGIPLALGEILRSSGKFAKPTKIAGKNYFKDEVIIRNSDSGKVNPGARDRLVQITGPHEDSISHAKLLVEDTIRRNASPVREKSDLLDIDITRNEGVNRNSYSDFDGQNFSMKKLAHSFSLGDATLSEYAFRFYVGQDAISLSGTNADLLKTAKLVLQEYFAGQAELNEMNHHDPASVTQSSISNFQNMTINDSSRYGLSKMPSKNSLQRSSSWMSSGSRASVSPLESSSDDEIFKNKEISPKNSTVTPANFSSSNAINDLKTREVFSSNANKTSNVLECVSHSIIPVATNAAGLNGMQGPQFPTVPLSPLEHDIGSSCQMSYDSDLRLPIVELHDSDNGPAIASPVRRKLSYSRDFLIKCAKSPHCNDPPVFNVDAVENFTFILRDSVPKQSTSDSSSKIV